LDKEQNPFPITFHLGNFYISNVKSAEPASSEPTVVDVSRMKCFSCNKYGHRATQCPQKPMSQEEQNAVAKALALEKQRTKHMRDIMSRETSINMLREVFDEASYREADANRQAILRIYRSPKKT
jgi:hypothetical protein